MEKVVSASLFLLLLAIFDNGLAQSAPRPVLPLSSNQSLPEIGQRYVHGQVIGVDATSRPSYAGSVEWPRTGQTQQSLQFQHQPDQSQLPMQQLQPQFGQSQPPRQQPQPQFGQSQPPRQQPQPQSGQSQPQRKTQSQPGLSQSGRPVQGHSRGPATNRTDPNPLKYPPPGANAPNTIAENLPLDSPEDGDSDADDSKEINAALRQFALDLLTKLGIDKPETNIIVSPFSVWTLLLAILEGAGGDTAHQIKTSLRLPLSMHKIQKNFKKLDKAMQFSGKSVVLESANALFSDINRPVLGKYSDRLHLVYRCSVLPLNFTNPLESVRQVNEWVADITRQRIKELIQKEDVENPEMILANVVYFKGSWEWPFNTSATYLDKFYNERKEQISVVPMMYQTGSYLYSFIAEINAHVLDMPYVDSKFRMLLVLPKPSTTVRNVLHAMKEFPVDACYDRLVHEQQEYSDDMVHVYVPRFKFKNKHQLGESLKSMGITDLFDGTRANLTGINAGTGIYLGEVLHSAEIEVNEEGTTASAASGGMFINKSGPLKFIANRPFIFFIVEHSQRTIIYAGRVFNPDR